MRFIFNLSVALFAIIFTAGAQEIALSKQTPADLSIRDLKIGDRVPAILMDKIINYKSRQANTQDFKDRLLILDFWDTYCSNCILALPKLDSLQQVFGNNITIMPVTYQDEVLVTDFFKKNRLVKGLKIPCVVEDKMLRSHFKHRFISHEVWIYKGVVKAITGTPYVTANNIRKILDGEKVDWPVKDDDFQFDATKPLFNLNQATKYQKQERFNSYSGLTGYRSGLDYKSGIVYDSLAHRTYFYNFSIVDAYKALLVGIERKDFLVDLNRIVLEVKNPQTYVYTEKDGYQVEWNEKNEFCYEMINHKVTGKRERFKLMLSDLNNKLGLNGRFERRLRKCLVFVKTGTSGVLDSLPRSGGVSMPDIAFYNVDYGLRGKYPPTVDETNFKGTIKLSPYDGTLVGLRKELQRHGFDIIEAEREIEVLVITEIGI